MKRAKHSLSHYRMVTADMGELFPIACVPVLPGDTAQHSTSAVVRVSPLNTPVMHPVAVRIHHFFVPNRILWPESEGGGWESFITGGSDGNDSQVPPVINNTTDKKSVLCYLGVPPKVVTVNELPLRAFNAIVNEYYLDQDLDTQRNEDDLTLPRISWEKDYFSTARPWTQKGAAVTLPLGTQAPVKGTGAESTLLSIANDTTSDNRILDLADGNHVGWDTASGTGDSLYADLSAAGAIDINDFRSAFAVQRYKEARARYGSRFTEYLRYCGITPSDARLQRPEYLGGGSARLNFSEVLQTSPNNPGTDQDGIGDLYGHGIAGIRSNAYRKFFEEHGYIISMMSVRPKALYVDGLQREFKKTTKEDYFQKELASLGQQEVFTREVFAENSGTVFGYQDRYDEYRHHQSYVSQDFRDTLDAWHMGRKFASAPTLNASFTQCNPSKRIFQTETDDTLWIMANHSLVMRRMVPRVARPRIL